MELKELRNKIVGLISKELDNTKDLTTNKNIGVLHGLLDGIVRFEAVISNPINRVVVNDNK